jgi:hypothetical protein
MVQAGTTRRRSGPSACRSSTRPRRTRTSECVRVCDVGNVEAHTSRKLLEEALGNFAIVILEPLDVDYVELGVVPKYA